MAFKLVNSHGNAFYTVKTEAQKEELIKRGFKEVPTSNKNGKTDKE